jgi:hypothetical protein
MSISDFSLKLLLLFLPGLVSFIVIDNLSTHRETKNIHWFVYSIILGLVSYSLLYMIELKAGITIAFWSTLVDSEKIIHYDEIMYSTIIGLVLGILLTFAINHGWFFRFFSGLRITQKHGYPDTLSYMLGLYNAQYLTVTDWEKEIRIVGELVAVSENIDQRDELVLQNCSVYNLDSGEKLYDIPVFYLAQNFDKITIEIDNSGNNDAELEKVDDKNATE